MSRLLSIATVSLIAASTLSLAAQQQAASAVAPVRSTVSKAALAKAKEHALTTIQGNALNSTNGPMNDAVVRLRDARFGRIVDTQLTDKSGLFAFKAIDPGSYIVEIMSNDQSILAASQLLNVNAGEAVSAVVKLPFRIPPFAGILGRHQHADRRGGGDRSRGEQRRGRRADDSDQPQSVAGSLRCSSPLPPARRDRPRRFGRDPPSRRASGGGRRSGRRTRRARTGAVHAGERRPPARSPRGPLPLPPVVRHRLRPRDGGDDHPGLQQPPDLPGAGAAAHRGRALHRDSRAAERSEHVLRRPRAVLPDAVQDSQRARPDAARRPEAASGNGAGVQRHEAAAADADLDAGRPQVAADGLRHEAAGAAAAPEPPKIDETADESALVGGVHRPRRRRSGARHPPGRRHVHLRGSEVRRRRGEHADRRVRQRKPRDQAAVDAGHARLARHRARDPAEARRGERARARRVPREGKRAVARRQAEHRALAPQPVERHGHARAEHARAEGVALQPGQGDRQRHQPRRDSDHRRERRRADRAEQARRSAAPEGPAARALRGQASAGHQRQRQAAGRAEAARHRNRRRGAVGPQRIRDGAHRGTDVREEPRRRQERSDRPEPQGHRLRRDGARGEEQPRGLPVAAHAREGAARLGQQPHQQRARGRPRRSAARPDHAGRPPHVADVGRHRAGAGGRRRARPRLHERHDQDARRTSPGA